MRKKTQYELEAQMTGHFPNLYRGTNNLHSEETRMVRLYNGKRDPIEGTVKGVQFMKAKNDHLADLHKENTLLSRKIIRPNIHTRYRSGIVPNPGSAWGQWLRNVPNVFRGSDTDKPQLEDQHYRFLDPYGHAGANPEHGKSYVWPNYLYYGNPWGAGGQAYSHLRQGGQINDYYLWPAKNNTYFLNK